MKLYVATKNDGLFIIDKQPRTSNDDIADIPGVNVIATMGSNDRRAQETANRMVEAYNTMFGAD